MQESAPTHKLTQITSKAHDEMVRTASRLCPKVCPLMSIRLAPCMKLFELNMNPFRAAMKRSKPGYSKLLHITRQAWPNTPHWPEAAKHCYTAVVRRAARKLPSWRNLDTRTSQVCRGTGDVREAVRPPESSDQFLSGSAKPCRASAVRPEC